MHCKCTQREFLSLSAGTVSLRNHFFASFKTQGIFAWQCSKPIHACPFCNVSFCWKLVSVVSSLLRVCPHASVSSIENEALKRRLFSCAGSVSLCLSIKQHAEHSPMWKGFQIQLWKQKRWIIECIEGEDKTFFPCPRFERVKLNKWKRMANFRSSIKSIISCLTLQETDKVYYSDSPLLRKSHFGKRQEYEKSWGVYLYIRIGRLICTKCSSPANKFCSLMLLGKCYFQGSSRDLNVCLTEKNTYKLYLPNITVLAY